MSRDEWFRSSRWTSDDQEEFEAKLARARPSNRTQYLRLKALALSESADKTARDGARALFERAIAADDELQSTMARADLAHWFEQSGNGMDAARAYRACSEGENALGGSLRTGVELDLAELIVRERWDAHYAEAFELLDRAASNGLSFEVQRWRYLVTGARLHARSGNQHEAQLAAREAVRLLESSRPDFARHPNVGRTRADPTTIAEIQALAN